MRDDRILEMRVFKAVTEHGNFTSAANALAVSQPFVSRLLTQLESRVGTNLLRRTTRRVALTTEGRKFLKLSNELLNHLDTIETCISLDAQGEVKVSAPTGFGMDQILPLIPRFIEKHPKIQVNLSTTDVPIDLIEDGFDLAIHMGSLRDSSFICRKLAPLKRTVIASPDFLERYGEPQHPQDLLNYNCLLSDSPLDHLNHWPFIIGDRNVSLRVSGSFRSIDGASIAQMCLSGFGIARVPDHFALPAIRQRKAVQLLPDYEMVDEGGIYIVFSGDKLIHPRVRAFIDFLADEFETPPWLV